jgi:hypothetical protein
MKFNLLHNRQYREFILIRAETLDLKGKLKPKQLFQFFLEKLINLLLKIPNLPLSFTALEFLLKSHFYGLFKTLNKIHLCIAFNKMHNIFIPLALDNT